MYYGCISVDTRIIVYYACIVVYYCITPCSVYLKTYVICYLLQGLPSTLALLRLCSKSRHPSRRYDSMQRSYAKKLPEIWFCRCTPPFAMRFRRDAEIAKIAAARTGRK